MVLVSVVFQWFQWYWLGRRPKDDKKQISRWIKIVSRFKANLVKMIGDAGSKFDIYSISPKTRQILLHWDYELTENNNYCCLNELMYENELLV